MGTRRAGCNPRRGHAHPGHLYYIAEYVMMIREAFADISISLRKTPKRNVRLREVLGDLARFIARKRGHIPPPVLPQSVPLVDGLAVAEKAVLTVMLKQFSEALDLDIDPGLAKEFDKLFATNLGARKAKANYPDSLKGAIAAEAGYNADHVNLGDAIGYAQWVAEQVGAHMSSLPSPGASPLCCMPNTPSLNAWTTWLLCAASI